MNQRVSPTSSAGLSPSELSRAWTKHLDGAAAAVEGLAKIVAGHALRANSTRVIFPALPAAAAAVSQSGGAWRVRGLSQQEQEREYGPGWGADATKSQLHGHKLVACLACT